MLTIEQVQDCADVNDAVEVVAKVIEQFIDNGDIYTFLQLCERANCNNGEGYIAEFVGRFYELCVGLRISEVEGHDTYTIISYGLDLSTQEEANTTVKKTCPVVMF